MKTRLFSILSVLLFLIPITSYAHRNADPSCEMDLIAIADEFSNPPRDFEQGLVTKKVPMTTTSLIEAYLRGIFPWTMDKDKNVYWYNPQKRGILMINQPIEEIIPARDLQFIRNAKKNGYTVTRNQAFTQVMEECANAKRFDTVETKDGPIKIPVTTTWIKPKFIEEFPKLVAIGLARSYEVWRDGKLVGGLYGSTVGGRFTGESMFSSDKNAAKLAVYELLLDEQALGHTWIDTQQVNGFLKRWHAIEIDRETFLQKVAEAEQASLPIQEF